MFTSLLPYRLLARGAGLSLVLLLAWGVLHAQERKQPKKQKQPASATVPLERNVPRHKQFLERAKKGDVEVLFLGDSITQGWERAGAKMWEKYFIPLKAANFGIGGDRTGHVLWRITEGKELEGINPKVAVLMIGTNNMGSNSAEDIAAGVKAIVKELHQQKPSMQILLLGIFPRSPKASDKVRDKIKTVNQDLAKLDGKDNVHYKDIGPKFLESDESLSKKIMPDFLHLSPQGYQIWAEAVEPEVRKLLKQ